MSDIKIFVSSHTPFPVPEHPLLQPIQVGAALTEERFPGYLQDDVGENISAKNRAYCELTTQYWAWKNIQAVYYGFFHYRRYLYPVLDEKRPYRVAAEPTLDLLDKLGYQDFSTIIEKYDLIAPKGEDMNIPVRRHYAQAKHHHGKDLALIEDIVKEQSPEYAEAMEHYLSGSICYFGNIFIASKEIFERYCTWLFPILEEFDRRANLAGYGPQESRVDGYLAERLFGVFYTELKAEGARTLELPRVDFIPNEKERRKRQITNALLPPGSTRRAVVKHFTNMI